MPANDRVFLSIRVYHMLTNAVLGDINVYQQLWFILFIHIHRYAFLQLVSMRGAAEEYIGHSSLAHICNSSTSPSKEGV